MKKFASIALCLCIALLMVTPFFSVAEGAYTSPTITVSDASVDSGAASASFDVTIFNNPGLWSVQFLFVYDSAMSFRSFENGQVFPSSDLTFSPAEESQIRDVNVASAFGLTGFKDAERVFRKQGVSYVNKKMTIYQFDTSSLINNTANGKVFTITLNTASLSDGIYDICLVYTPDNTINKDFENVNFNVVHGRLRVGDVPMCVHDYAAVVTAPTCTAQGFTTYTCVHCGESYTADETPALGHDFSDTFSIDTQPTKSAPGSKSMHCARCDAVTNTTQVVYKTGDIVGDGVVNLYDIQQIKAYIAGMVGVDQTVTVNSDMNSDNVVNLMDIALLKAYIAG